MWRRSHTRHEPRIDLVPRIGSFFFGSGYFAILILEKSRDTGAPEVPRVTNPSSPRKAARNSILGSARTGRTRALAMDGWLFDESCPARSDVTKRTSRGPWGFYGGAMETLSSNPLATAREGTVVSCVGSKASPGVRTGCTDRRPVVPATIFGACVGSAVSDVTKISSRASASCSMWGMTQAAEAKKIWNGSKPIRGLMRYGGELELRARRERH